RTQRVLVIIALVLFVLMGLLPPWKQAGRYAGSGYHPLWNDEYSTVDFFRLLLQWLLLGVLIGGALFVTATPKEKIVTRRELDAAVQAAILAEREACARQAELFFVADGRMDRNHEARWNDAVRKVVSAIRDRTP